MNAVPRVSSKKRSSFTFSSQYKLQAECYNIYAFCQFNEKIMRHQMLKSSPIFTYDEHVIMYGAQLETATTVVCQQKRAKKWEWPSNIPVIPKV